MCIIICVFYFCILYPLLGATRIHNIIFISFIFIFLTNIQIHAITYENCQNNICSSNTSSSPFPPLRILYKYLCVCQICAPRRTVYMPGHKLCARTRQRPGAAQRQRGHFAVVAGRPKGLYSHIRSPHRIRTLCVAARLPKQIRYTLALCPIIYIYMFLQEHVSWMRV